MPKIEQIFTSHADEREQKSLDEFASVKLVPVLLIHIASLMNFGSFHHGTLREGIL